MTIKKKEPEHPVKEQLQEVQQKFQAVFDAAPIGLIHLDSQGRILEINRWCLEKLTESSRIPEELVGQLFTDTQIGRTLDLGAAVKKVLQGQKFAKSKLKLRDKSGKLKGRLGLSGIPLYGSSNNVSGALLILEDITAQKELDEKICQSQMLVTAGTLAGSLSLDFNNLLGAVLGHASFLRTRMDPNNPLFRDVEAIELASQRAAELAHKLCVLTQPSSGEHSSLDLNKACREIATIVQRAFERRITFSFELDPAIPLIAADEVQIYRVLVNLYMNSHDAMPHGGTLRIRTGFINEKESRAIGLANAPEGGVRVSVQDEGIGMTPEVRAKIFQPFFSTKTDAQHIGLGLSSVQSIVNQHAGVIRVESQVGRGSVFTLYFPATSKKLGTADRQEGPMTRGDELVLLVDDEPVIRTMGLRLLEAGGYQVITASDGQEAIELFHEHQRDVDLVILDLVMPQMNGQEVLEKLLEISPRAKVLLSSGYASESGAQSVISSGAMGFIQKPYRMKSLLQKMREVLDEQETGSDRQSEGAEKDITAIEV